MDILEMKDRIAHIIRSKNLTAAEFALQLGIQPSNISHLLSGRNNPSLDFVKKLKERVDVSNLKIKDASITQKDSNTADISALLHNNKLNKDFNINFRMDKLANGEWQIKEITNFVELLTKVEEATKQAAREAVNETVQEKKKQ